MPWRNLVLTALLGAFVVIAATGIVDAPGSEFTDRGIKRALVAFGAARALNAVISAVQGTEIAVEPLGVGVTFAPGELLDPINDLVEQLSWVLLASATAFTVQKFVLLFAAYPVFTWLLGLGALASAVCLWTKLPHRELLLPVFLRATAVLLIVRFAIPVMALASEGVYEALLEPRYEHSLAQLKDTTEELGELGTEDIEAGDADTSWFEKLKQSPNLFKSTSEVFSVREKMDRYVKAAENVADRIVNLIAVFVLQTVVIPLVFLWLALHGLRRMIFPAPR